MTIEELEDDFVKVCKLCLEDENLVNEFCRLKGVKRPDRRSPIEIQIDNVCKYDADVDFIKQFTDFVREFVYVPLLKQQLSC